jgi:glycosyltransferase involved in cell wall biosynthesis
MNDVTVLLSGYKRPYSLVEQYNAVKNQTYKNIDIILWINEVDGVSFDQDILNVCKTIKSTENYGVWGRFAIALNFPTKYVCIIDDDTIPGCKWIENCINTISKYKGVITTRGVIMEAGKDHLYPLPESYTAHGWCNPNAGVKKVDMGCHCWFFERDLLRSFWNSMPQNTPMNYGEDMHLSFVAQMNHGLGTYVAPHPVDDTDLWGSNAKTGESYGSDENAISWNNQANAGMRSYWNYMRANGYKIVNGET